jgi:DNA-binding PadR family transcriptional regulator
MGRSRTAALMRPVLLALLDDPARERHGLELSRAAGLMTGTIYPVLSRLEELGWVQSRWDTTQGRRLYRLTPDGAEQAAKAPATPVGRRLPVLAPGVVT